jgi:hypothetical protein
MPCISKNLEVPRQQLIWQHTGQSNYYYEGERDREGKKKGRKQKA